MHSSFLLSQILKGNWLIEPGFAETQGPVISNILNRYTEFKKGEPDKMSAFAVAPDAARTTRYSYLDGFDRAPSGSIAIVGLKGVLLKDDQYCGPRGTATIGEILKAADAHENISGIVLHIDSPGGTVDGTEALGNIVKAIEKPVVTFVDGLMASAAIWVGSYADEIIASTDTDEIGSVGVMLSFADVQPYWEKIGIKFHTINASTSPDKNKTWEDLRAGKYDAYKKNVLDPLDKKFMTIIRENLPNVTDEHLTGKMFFARDLMGIIVDSIGTLDDAVNRASELAQINNTGNDGVSAHINTESDVEDTAVKEKPAETETTNLKNNMKQFKNVNAALGVENLEAVDEVVSLNEEQLEALDTKLGNDTSTELQSRLDAAEETIGSKETTISKRDATIAANVETIAAKDKTIAEHVAEIARLKGKAIEDTTAGKPAGDDNDLGKKDVKTVVSDDDDFATQLEKVRNEYLSNL